MKINVVVTAYNHEKYIAQCLESVLKQKGDFQIEVIVGDDCSTDNTRKIINEFHERYPKIISVLPPEKNLGVTKNLKRCLDACTGDYIAICEGDDYWTDEYKLQKQKDFLDQHNDCSMCFSAFIIFWEETGKFELHRDPIYDPFYLKRDFITTEDLIEQNYIGNFSCCMYRNKVIKQLPQKIFEIFTVDWMFNMACGEFGKIGFIRDWMSVYRRHAHGAWAGQSRLENEKNIVQCIDLYNEYFEKKYDMLFMKRKAYFEADIIRLQTAPNKAGFFRRGLEKLTFSILIMAKKATPLWFKNLIKKEYQAIRSNEVLFSFIKRITPEFMIRIYSKFRSL